MMKKKLLTLLAAATLTLGMSVTALAADQTEANEATATDAEFVEEVEELNVDAGTVTGKWKKDSKGWYFDYGNGKYAKDCFLVIGGKTYHIDTKGYMTIGWLQYQGYWLWFDASGVMCGTGWKNIGNKWYYFIKTNSGHHVVDPKTVGSNGEYTVNGKAYYFDANGALKTGWIKYGTGKWKYFSQNGVFSGWQRVGTHWCYFDPTTKYAYIDVERKIDGSIYRFDANGYMMKGWVKNPSSWQKRGYSTYSYYRSDGKAYEGWLQYKGKWYCFYRGNMRRGGLVQIDGEWHNFDDNGVWLGKVSMGY